MNNSAQLELVNEMLMHLGVPRLSVCVAGQFHCHMMKCHMLQLIVRIDYSELKVG